MATYTLRGVNFGVGDGAAAFFGARGERLSDERWLVTDMFGQTPTEVAPKSMLSDIQAVVQSDTEGGFGDRFTQLRVGPAEAVILYLEGQINRTHMEKATEGPKIIDIPGVKIDGRQWTVRVLASPTYIVDTADADGVTP